MKLNGLKIKFINAELVNAIKLFNIFYCVGSWKVEMWQLRCGTNLVLALIRRIRVRIELCMYIYATMLDFYRMIDTKRTFCPCRITTKTNYMYVCMLSLCMRSCGFFNWNMQHFTNTMIMYEIKSLLRHTLKITCVTQTILFNLATKLTELKEYSSFK